MVSYPIFTLQLGKNLRMDKNDAKILIIRQANQQLLHIRKIELEYFEKVFSRFCIQGALLAGFVVDCTLCNVDIRGSDVGIWWRWGAYMSIPVLICIGLFVVLASTFANTFGGGFALRGPAGSVVRTIVELMAEQSAVFYSYVVGIVLLQSSTVALAFILMDRYAAVVTTAIVVIAAFVWYHYCWRIYHRFRLPKNEVFVPDSSLDMSPHSRMSRSSIIRAGSGRFADEDVAALLLSAVSSEGATGLRLGSHDKRLLSIDDPRVEEILTALQSDPLVSNAMEGYLTIERMKRNMFESRWCRRYAVLKRSSLYFYENRAAYQEAPQRSINTRPIKLNSYTALPYLATDTTPMRIVLQPPALINSKDELELRCDTEEELQQWLAALQRARVRIVHTDDDS